MRSNESSEDYLETILILGNRSSLVRAVDIAAEMGFKKPSVSVAMKNLRENGYVVINKEGHIFLTDAGREIAEMIYERHTLLSTWLISMGVSPETSAEDACRMEHVLSKESFSAIKEHVEKYHM